LLLTTQRSNVQPVHIHRSLKRCRNKTASHALQAISAFCQISTKNKSVPLATTAPSALAMQHKIHVHKAPIVQQLDLPIKTSVSHAVLSCNVPPQRCKSLHLAHQATITTITCRLSIVICARQVTHATSEMHTLNLVQRVTTLIEERQSALGVIWVISAPLRERQKLR